MANPTNSQPPPVNQPAGPSVNTGTAPAASPPAQPAVSPGLELMIPLNYLFVRQQIEPMEIYRRVETPNRYDVLAGNGQMIYLAQETLGFLGMLRGAARAFRIDIINSAGQLVMILNRFDNPTRGEMMVTLPDWSVLGAVIQTNYFTPYFEIRDGPGTLLMIITLSAPPGGNWFSGESYFIVSMPNGYRLGLIRKLWAGRVQEAISDADNFGVEFPADLDVRWKALMLAAVFLIDFLYFETNARRRR